MSDLTKLEVSAQNIVVAINNLTKATQNVTFKAPQTTSSTIPTAASAGAGSIRFVADSSTSTRLATYTGGGANAVIIFSNGIAWLVL